jgi:large subunit ribosomal protein L6
MRTLIAKMIIGVTTGCTKTLLMKGVGYKAELKGKDLVVSVGFSHPVVFPYQEGIEFQVQDLTTINISGCNNELVGQMASTIRKLREPEPYKGKGIFYVVNGVPEYVARKEGKRASG